MTDLRSLQDMLNGTGDSSAPRKPKPLVLADMLDADARSFETKQQAAFELRRMHEENEALRQALAQPEQEPLGSEWVPCVKLPVIVHVRNQRDGETHISTREGITPVLPDDLIMRGVAGEEYPIGRELFERTYTFDVDDVNMSEECVHKTDKCEHEIQNGGTYQQVPTKCKWVGLTDEEIHEVVNKKWWDWEDAFDIEGFSRAIEAKLKEKNT